MEHEPADSFNDGFVQMMYESFLSNPDSVAAEWREMFAQQAGNGGRTATAAVPAATRAAAPTAGGASAAPAQPAGAAAPELPAGAELMRGPAAGLVRNMNESLSVPTATTFRTVAVAALEANRRSLNEDLAAQGRKLSFTHLIALALVDAWRAHPVMGHGFREVAGKPYRLRAEHLNLGLAVDVQKSDGSRGLMVPRIAAADAMSVREFVDAYDDIVARARTGAITVDEMVGTTLTLTNPGGLGTVASVPRLMAGQGTIVATGAIAHPAEFRHLSAARLVELGVSKVMTLTSTYDHRVIQGAESGAFLRVVDDLLQGGQGFYERVRDALVDAGAAQGTMAIAMPGAVAPAPIDAAAAATATPAVEAEPGALLETEPFAHPDTGIVTTSTEQLASVAAAMGLVKALRTHGHLAANLDPLGSPPVGDPSLDPQTLGLSDEIMRTIPASVLRIGVEGETLADALPRLREKYCGTIAYEIEHIADHDQRVWLRRMIESGEHRRCPTAAEKVAVLERLTDVEVFERFVRRAYLAAKQFSVEGLDVMVPMIDEALTIAARQGAQSVVLGMSHRGRLNVLTHILGRPYESILREFEAEHRVIAGTALPKGGTGDVKYHQGASGTYESAHGPVEVTLSHNPSHLEAVNPVVEGRTRAAQTTVKGREVLHDAEVALPIIIHGDAAFPGQGIVAETLNLQSLEGYATGGTIHLIANNQLGFTTTPDDGRSTRYASDLAKGFDVPIVHVNADDAIACIAAIRLAMAYRHRFHRDVVIDLIGYRRHGHNETDEPGYTQPRMYSQIASHRRVRELFADFLTEHGLVTAEQVQRMYDERYAAISEVQEHVLQVGEREPSELETPTGDYIDYTARNEPETELDEATVRSLCARLVQVPEDFTVHPKLARQLDRRAKSPDERFDYGTAEAVALASLLQQGMPVRFTGQDAGRGTFAHRHMVLHDVNTGERYAPIQHLPDAQAGLEIFNSPLSESACLGFEYGYATASPDSLVVWEAQFGDFVNNAQVMVDQFVMSSMVKWGLTSRLTLLLPHGYEGNGPEHSNARLHRFLAGAAEGSVRIANPTTAAQHFHLLRRQGMIGRRRPLVVFTPKGLLRAAHATSPLSELTSGRFEFVLDDPMFTGDGASASRDSVTRLVLCSGKLYYDIAGHAERAGATGVAVARIELLYPFPKKQVAELMLTYPNLREVVWAQEEPQNFGAYPYVLQRTGQFMPEGGSLAYVGRPKRASTSEGYTSVHLVEQERIVREALALEPAAG